MSLLRLLSTGRSLVDFRDSGSRYRVTRQKLLPKFGSARNPFRAPQRSERPAVPAVPAAAVTEPKGQPVRQPGLRPVLATARQWRAWATGQVARWWRPRPRPVRAAQPAQAARLPTQGELSLASVKVMRNDLSDADLEVVPARVRAAGAVAVAKADAGSSAWGRMSTRLFGAGKR
jgi:hypothetical protein